jgi:hypothetical protein
MIGQEKEEKQAEKKKHNITTAISLAAWGE